MGCQNANYTMALPDNRPWSTSLELSQYFLAVTTTFEGSVTVPITITNAGPVTIELTSNADGYTLVLSGTGSTINPEQSLTVELTVNAIERNGPLITLLSPGLYDFYLLINTSQGASGPSAYLTIYLSVE